MTDGEIFLKVLEKAKKGGMDFNKPMPESHFYYDIIFSPSFAEAFWGTEVIYNLNFLRDKYHFLGLGYETALGSHHIGMEEWQYHFQQMVLFPKPLKYLKKFLEEEVK